MTMLERQLAHGRVYRRLAVHQRRRARASAAIETMRAVAPHAYCSLSWGKQSIIVAHMLYLVDPTIPCFFLASSESWALHNFREVIDAFLARWPVRLTIVQTDRWSGVADWQEAKRRGQQDLQRVAGHRIADEPGEWQGWYGGLARDESRARRIALSMRSDSGHPDVYHYRHGGYRCSPLASWTLPDLAAYLDEFDLPLLRIYHEQGLAARSTARITGRMVRQGGAIGGDVSGWNHLLNRFPEISVWR
jgi:3'-phosphoadenosine 5'-phosphosulfate sulfotransferase (PAPS reductase)/FAD synthetase